MPRVLGYAAQYRAAGLRTDPAVARTGAAPASGSDASIVAAAESSAPARRRSTRSRSPRSTSGTPYHFGGASPQTGFDCSGLAQYAYGQSGVSLPRVAADQYTVGQPVDRASLQPGDLVFFHDSTGYIHHEAIYLGGDNFIQAPHTGDVVKISSLDDPYYAGQFAGGRRVA